MGKLNLFFVSLITFLLTACACPCKKPVTQAQLPNGTPIKVGMANPIGWNCSTVSATSFSSSDYDEVKQQALNYAGVNKIKANYIYMRLPNLMTDPKGSSYVTYYQCEYVNPHNNA